MVNRLPENRDGRKRPEKPKAGSKAVAFLSALLATSAVACVDDVDNSPDLAQIEKALEAGDDLRTASMFDAELLEPNFEVRSFGVDGLFGRDRGSDEIYQMVDTDGDDVYDSEILREDLNAYTLDGTRISLPPVQVSPDYPDLVITNGSVIYVKSLVPEHDGAFLGPISWGGSRSDFFVHGDKYVVLGEWGDFYVMNLSDMDAFARGEIDEVPHVRTDRSDVFDAWDLRWDLGPEGYYAALSGNIGFMDGVLFARNGAEGLPDAFDLTIDEDNRVRCVRNWDAETMVTGAYPGFFDVENEFDTAWRDTGSGMEQVLVSMVDGQYVYRYEAPVEPDPEPDVDAGDAGSDAPDDSGDAGMDTGSDADAGDAGSDASPDTGDAGTDVPDDSGDAGMDTGSDAVEVLSDSLAIDYLGADMVPGREAVVRIEMDVACEGECTDPQVEVYIVKAADFDEVFDPENGVGPQFKDAETPYILFTTTLPGNELNFDRNGEGSVVIEEVVDGGEGSYEAIAVVRTGDVYDGGTLVREGGSVVDHTEFYAEAVSSGEDTGAGADAGQDADVLSSGDAGPDASADAGMDAGADSGNVDRGGGNGGGCSTAQQETRGSLGSVLGAMGILGLLGMRRKEEDDK